MLKPFSFHPKLAIVTRTLTVALSDLQYFFLIFLPMFVAYVISGHILFGTTVKKFSTLYGTAVTAANLILLGEHQWDEMFLEHDSVIRKLYVFSFFPCTFCFHVFGLYMQLCDRLVLVIPCSDVLGHAEYFAGYRYGFVRNC